MQILSILLLISFSFGKLNAQMRLNIQGTVIEKSSSKTMEYCTISAYTQNDSSLVTGTVSDLDGNFMIPLKAPGKYFLKVSYIGFESKKIYNILVSKNQPEVSLGNISMEVNDKRIEEVEISGSRKTIRYEMDKKVISVDKTITSSTGTAVDVLESIPSITVNLNGDVSLRGNSNFQVLINGKPTVLDASEALRQTSSTNIKNIEIITNPSAKYEAGSSGGIINIVLKEEKKLGTSGVIGLSVGTFKNFGGNVNIKHNIKKFSFDFSASLRSRNMPKDIQDSVRTTYNEIVTTSRKGDDSWNFGGYSFKYGMGYKINKNNSLQLDLVYGRWGMTVFQNENTIITNETQNTVIKSFDVNDQQRGAPYFGPSLSYSGEFKNKSNLSAYVGFSQRDFKEDIKNASYRSDELYNGTRSTEEGLMTRLRAKVDYTLPIKKGKLEFGGNLRAALNEEVTKNYSLDINSLGYDLLDINNKNITYQQAIYGLYSTYGNKYKKFTYSLGFRAEYTDREIKIKEDAILFNYYRWNFFPTAHLSFTIDEASQIYASFSRRIRRPRGYYLEPLAIKFSNTAYYQGNPELKPTISNSMELGYSKTLKKNTNLSFEAFYKINTNEIEFITFGNEDNTTTTQPNNIGERQNIGLEANVNFKPFKWWNIEMMGTAYYSTLNGEFQSIVYDKDFFQWGARINQFFNVTKTTRIQFTGNYRSAQESALGTELDFLNFDLGVKQSFLKKSLSFALNARNIFHTIREGDTNVSENYYFNSYNAPKWPIISLSASYSINNHRQNRRATESGQGEF